PELLRLAGPTWSLMSQAGWLDERDVDRLGALGPLARLVLDLRTLRQRAEARSVDVGEVDEQVLATLVGVDETEPLGIVEPLHGSGRHSGTSRSRTLEVHVPANHTDVLSLTAGQTDRRSQDTTQEAESRRFRQSGPRWRGNPPP